jgi:hypothetical protein
MDLSERVPEVLKVSGINYSDLAYLVGVARQTPLNWINGRIPQPCIAARAEAILDMLEDAVDAGHLPLRASLNAKARRLKLIHVLRQPAEQ